MGDGYSILIWDEWGGGLVKVNARLLVEGEDCYGNPKNWFPCKRDTSEKEILKKHGLTEADYYTIIRN